MDEEKQNRQIQYPFMARTLSELGIEEMHLNTIKSIYTVNLILSGEKMEKFFS